MRNLISYSFMHIELTEKGAGILLLICGFVLGFLFSLLYASFKEEVLKH
jgi:hypothetical protein